VPTAGLSSRRRRNSSSSSGRETTRACGTTDRLERRTVGFVSTPASGPVGRKGRRHNKRVELANSTLRGGIRPGTPVGAFVYDVAILATLWLVVVIDALANHWLHRFGIKPRQVDGLAGIALSPFIHADAAQLAGLTLPLAAFAWLLLLGRVRDAVLVTVAVMLASGIVDWLLGPSNKILLGASGVVFGWFGYLIARAWFSRRLQWIAVAVIVIAVFSSMFTALLPSLGSNAYWGGRVAGFIAGLLVAGAMHRRRDGRSRPSTSVQPSGSA
jgi:membrane associated rhomboid family serine protease